MLKVLILSNTERQLNTKAYMLLTLPVTVAPPAELFDLLLAVDVLLCDAIAALAAAALEEFGLDTRGGARFSDGDPDMILMRLQSSFFSSSVLARLAGAGEGCRLGKSFEGALAADVFSSSLSLSELLPDEEEDEEPLELLLSLKHEIR